MFSVTRWTDDYQNQHYKLCFKLHLLENKFVGTSLQSNFLHCIVVPIVESRKQTTVYGDGQLVAVKMFFFL